MYLSDQKNTKGHTHAVCNVQWHPEEKSIFFSCGNDATLRIWAIEKMEEKQKEVIKLRNAQGKKNSASYCACSYDAKYVVVGFEDGTIQFWYPKGPFNRPKITIKAHQPGNGITCICFSQDDQTLVSRSMDDTMKIWDVRNNKEPLAIFDNLKNFGDVKCTFSPDENLILTGTSEKKGESTGLLVFYDKKEMKRVQQIGICKGGSVCAMLWHPSINQIVLGTSLSKVRVLYDPNLSKKGPLLCATRTPRIKDPNDYEPPRPILTPYALPMFYETPNSKRKWARERLDPRKTAKISPDPEEVFTGPGRAGKIGTSVT